MAASYSGIFFYLFIFLAEGQTLVIHLSGQIYGQTASNIFNVVCYVMYVMLLANKLTESFSIEL